MKCILFDLDGTLLPMNNDVFTKSYFSAITKFCASKIPPESFMKYLMKGTQQMILNESDTSNEDVFKKSFLELSNMAEEDIFPHFENFYKTDYLRLIDSTSPSTLSYDVVKAAVDKGYGIILATNAVFPKIAVEERMKWAGIDKLPWLGITNYEATRGCKPNLRYYRYIIETFNVDPDGSWMIGNDAFEDMVAKKLGLSTYLVTDFAIESNEECLTPDAKGTLKDCLDFITNELPTV